MDSAELQRDPRLYLKIAGAVLQDIEDGIFKPGDLLPSLNMLTKVFMVSRRTAGQALQLLEAEGWLRRVPGHGYYVCE